MAWFDTQLTKRGIGSGLAEVAATDVPLNRQLVVYNGVVLLGNGVDQAQNLAVFIEQATAAATPKLAACGGGGYADAVAPTGTAGTLRTKWTAPAECKWPRLVFINQSRVTNSVAGDSAYKTAGDDAATTTVVGIKCSIEKADGSIYPVTFSGIRSASCAKGQVLVSDPCPVVLDVGEVFWTRCYYADQLNSTAGTKVAAWGATRGSAVTAAGLATGEGWSTTNDYADSGTIAGSTTVAAFGPACIVGETSSAGVFIIGDSIEAGANLGETGEYFMGAGWIRRACRIAGMSTFNGGIGSEKVQDVVAAGYSSLFLRRQFARYADVAIVGYGINDLAAGRTAAQVMADLTRLHTQLANLGLRVYQRTVLPRVTGTYLTTAGQTVSGYEAARVSLNALIRAVPTPLSGVIDVADVCETARDSGKWKNPNDVPALSFTNDIGSAYALGLTTATWTVDQWKNYMLQKSDAPTSFAVINSNTATTAYTHSFATNATGLTVNIWEQWTSDGVHPNAYGSSQIAAAVAAQVGSL
jgi:lysophospholipase L1-like esterase